MRSASNPLTEEGLKNLEELNPGNINACKYEVIDSKVEFFPCVSGRCYPSEPQQYYAEFLVKELNEHLHHDGKWRVVLRDPVKSKWDKHSKMFRPYLPTKIECQYLDKDDDVQFVVAMEQPVEKLIEWGLNHALDLCEAGWRQFREMMTLIDVNDDQMIRAAKGQRSVNEAEQYAVD